MTYNPSSKLVAFDVISNMLICNLSECEADLSNFTITRYYVPEDNAPEVAVHCGHCGGTKILTKGLYPEFGEIQIDKLTEEVVGFASTHKHPLRGEEEKTGRKFR